MPIYIGALLTSANCHKPYNFYEPNLIQNLVPTILSAISLITYFTANYSIFCNTKLFYKILPCET